MKRILLFVTALLMTSVVFCQKPGTSRAPATREPSMSRQAPTSRTVERTSQSRTTTYSAPARKQQPAPSRNNSYKPTDARNANTRPAASAPNSNTVRQSAPSTTKVDYTRRPSSQAPSDRSAVDDSPYRIPEKPSGQTPTQESKRFPGAKPGDGPGHRPGDNWNSGQFQGSEHGHSYGRVHHVPHGYHPKPPMYHPIHHRPMHMYYNPHVVWAYDYVIWRNYWYYMYTVRYMEPSIVIYNFNATYRTNVLLDYIISDELIFSLYRDRYECRTYFAITDRNDNTIARVQVGRRYTKLMSDETGVWVLSKSGDRPIYFMLIDGMLYMYDTD